MLPTSVPFLSSGDEGDIPRTCGGKRTRRDALVDSRSASQSTTTSQGRLTTRSDAAIANGSRGPLLQYVTLCSSNMLEELPQG
jgi:hypothetical protein